VSEPTDMFGFPLVAAEPGPPFVVRKYGHLVHVTDEELRWAEDVRQAQEAFSALPLEEQRRLRAEAEARAAVEKAERTCPNCGCDPDEHGGY
jgi:hypothetical protein